MKKSIFLSIFLAFIFLGNFNAAYAVKKSKAKPSTTPTVSPSPSPTPEAAPKPKWIPAPQPKEEARTLSFLIFSSYRDDSSGSNLFSIGDLRARKKLDEFSVTTDLQVRFLKNLSSSDSAQNIELRLAKITFIEPWLQFSVGRMDLYPFLTPMSFFGAYPDMGIHRVDGALVVLPVMFQFGIQNYESFNAPPMALSIFYTPSILEAGDVVLDTQQSFLLTQARFKVPILGAETSWRANFAWTGTKYFAYSSLNGGTALSLTGEVVIDKDYSVYGEYGVQNTDLFTNTNVLGVGAKAQRIATWGPLSLDSISIETQLPLSNDPRNIFNGGNNFDPSLAQTPQITWYGDLKTRIKAISITFAVTNNLDDYTLSRVTPLNSSIPFTGQFGPGRELDKNQVGLKASSFDEPGFMVTVSVDF